MSLNMSRHRYAQFILCSFVLVYSVSALAWGRRGHALICETAAYLVAAEKDPNLPSPFFKIHSYDLGYYCNVPDFIWKRPATYGKERPNHFMNLEAFERELGPNKTFFGHPAFLLSRKDFDEKYTKLPDKNGRAWWRVQELYKTLLDLSRKLQAKKLTKKEKHRLQARWLLVGGVIGHYVADLAMPLHVSENYDGESTNQKGMHHFFEERMVDHLFLQPNFSLQGVVYRKALVRWKEFYRNNQRKTVLSWTQELSKSSQQAVPKLLNVDKETGRKSMNRASAAHKDLVIERLVQGVLYQALVLAKAQQGLAFDEEKFYNFVESPEFIGY